MSGRSILIVDDDEELIGETVELLESEGYSVDAAMDGGKARELIRTKSHSVYLIDFKMPGITGLEILKEIKKKHPKAAVFFVSGRPDLAKLIEKEKMTDEIHGILEKPFEPGLLLAAIKAV